ncbi:crotonase/enoyl-CoA hydratase family protein [Pseudoduganella namucuonensis]|uniref:Vanillin synthase /trans-feruloyl-CoA hydratase n=1 Tax=Pseudoduganella namucuonensis TaxID=1035707 RepID=A0A1I7L7Q7_9BURK|nr:crotonase/enoyl-CoA hydratase family protein [Pseudoduganella namucuonensis]SFV05658.1 vanillin synthase /trans-feruloyl-CoA hydratase [Pseudoduganella namucuonensis]
MSPETSQESNAANPAHTAGELLNIQYEGAVARISINRAAKRNALSDALVLALRNAFETLPEAVKVVVLSGEGEHFCAGLDLSEMRERATGEAMHHSRMWHGAFEQVQFGRVPVIAVLRGAVVGGGLELAAAAHIRVAEASAFYALPEGQRGLFVGGGGSVRISRLVGVPAMTDMMLTGRVLSADDGYRTGVSQYLVGEGEGMAKAMELAARIADNAAMSNYAVMHVLPRIADQSIQDGLVTESLMAAVAVSEPETRDRLAAFLDRKINKVQFKA